MMNSKELMQTWGHVYVLVNDFAHTVVTRILFILFHVFTDKHKILLTKKNKQYVFIMGNILS